MSPMKKIRNAQAMVIIGSEYAPEMKHFYRAQQDRVHAGPMFVDNFTKHVDKPSEEILAVAPKGPAGS